MNCYDNGITIEIVHATTWAEAAFKHSKIKDMDDNVLTSLEGTKQALVNVVEIVPEGPVAKPSE